MNSAMPLWLWLVFGGSVLAALIVDFFSLKSEKGAQAPSVREAVRWSLAWVGLSMGFMALLWWASYQQSGELALANGRALEFLTGYLIEKSLAVDNIFVFLMIFGYFSVPAAQQKRVLMLGIVLAIVLRAVLILAGAWLIEQFHWLLYLFGAFLLLTGIKMWWAAGQTPDLERNPALRLLRRVMPVSPQLDGERLFTRVDGRRMATPLLLVVALVGMTDLIFAVDSIPAIFAVTRDPFIVLSSNLFAVLGLRAMYFLLAAMAERFHLLSYGLAVVLGFIGLKMMAMDFVHLPVLGSLAVVLAILGASMWLSLRHPPSAQG